MTGLWFAAVLCALATMGLLGVGTLMLLWGDPMGLFLILVGLLYGTCCIGAYREE